MVHTYCLILFLEFQFFATISASAYEALSEKLVPCGYRVDNKQLTEIKHELEEGKERKANEKKKCKFLTLNTTK